MLTYLGLLAVTFFIGRVIPIDPVLAIVGDRAPEHLVAKVREELGLNKPLWHQFYIYLSKVLQGDFGTSVLTSNPVLSDIKRTFPATIELATLGIIIGAGIGVPLGVWAAVRRGGLADHVVRVMGLVGYSVPIFWLGLMALVLKKYIFKETYELYNEGLPAYRLPKLKRILRFMWHNAKMFINKIIGAILIASIVIWFLGYFPNNRENKNIESSYLGMTGKFIEPAIAPLGFDWRMGISLISGIAAKETIVGLMSQLYQTEHRPGSDKQNLIESLRTQTYTIGPRQGQNIFNPVVALSFIFFVSLYTPCVATIASIHKTVKKRKWTVMVILYTTLLAWLVSFMIYHIGSFFFL